MSRTFGHNHKNYFGWKPGVKSESKHLRHHSKEYCKKVKEDIEIAEEECPAIVKEVSNRWNWD